jgi:hypothetical protein
MGEGFLLRVLWCSQNGDNHENDLAIFGYILHTQVNNNNNNKP